MQFWGRQGVLSDVNDDLGKKVVLFEGTKAPLLGKMTILSFFGLCKPTKCIINANKTMKGVAFPCG